MKTIILASGGTGGHIFPAEALAAELGRRGYRTVLLTDNRYKNYKNSKANKLEVRVVSSSHLGGGIWAKIKGVMCLGYGFIQARKLLKELKPSVVVGFGGYPSFPTVYMAGRMGIKTIIHEQNSMLGRANYVLAGKVDVIATSFEEVAGIMEEDVSKVCLTGNPVRNAIKAVRDMDYPDINESGMLRILITGGSQGASVFSKVVPEAVSMLSADFRERIRIDQQCRKGCVGEAKSMYKELGVSADLSTFFNDMPLRLASSHLVIARSGASTLAEISVAGRPVIMVPYPHAMDDHQRVNANALEETGGGWLMPQESFTAAALSARLEAFLNLPSTLEEAAVKSRAAGRVDADVRLADLVDGLTDSEVGEDVSVSANAKEAGLSKLDELES